MSFCKSSKASTPLANRRHAAPGASRRCTRTSLCQHTSARESGCVRIRQDTSGYVRIRQRAYVRIRQDTSGYISRRCTRPRVCVILASTYVSIRQHTSAYVSIRCTRPRVCVILASTFRYTFSSHMRLKTRMLEKAYVSIRHTPAYVSIHILQPHALKEADARERGEF